MTNTKPMAPTDAEIDALWVGQQLTVPQLVQRRVIARAVLAKWGAQPVVREPLTDEQVEDLRGEANRGFDIEREHYFKAFRDAEVAHGIKGGQHGADTRSN